MRTRNWAFTFFPPESLITHAQGEYFYRGHRILEETSLCFNLFIGSGKYACQWEIAPTTGRLHIHAFIVFANPRTFAGVERDILNAFGPSKIKYVTDIISAYEYVTKTETRAAGPLFYPEPWRPRGSQGARTDITNAVVTLRNGGWDELIDVHTDTFVKYHAGFQKVRESFERRQRRARRFVRVWTLWGASGVGKTSAAFKLAPDLFRLSLPGRGEPTWFCGYMGESVLLLDDYYGQLSLSHFLHICDGWPFRLNVKGGSAWANYERVIITSNVAPQDWYPNLETFKEDLQQAFWRRLNSGEIIHCTEQTTNFISSFQFRDQDQPDSPSDQ